MCIAECKEVLKKNIKVIADIFEANLKQDTEKIVACFYSCFKAAFIKRALIIYNSYPKDFIEFISNTSFTDSILLFTKKAEAGEIYDSNASVKTVLLKFYTIKLLQNLQTEKRIAEKKIKYTIGYKEETTTMHYEGDTNNENNFLILEQALAKMEPADRQIIIWRHLDAKTCDEIAVLLGIIVPLANICTFIIKYRTSKPFTL